LQSEEYVDWFEDYEDEFTHRVTLSKMIEYFNKGILRRYLLNNFTPKRIPDLMGKQKKIIIKIGIEKAKK
jgi:hypothetical protein